MFCYDPFLFLFSLFPCLFIFGEVTPGDVMLGGEAGLADWICGGLGEQRKRGSEANALFACHVNNKNSGVENGEQLLGRSTRLRCFRCLVSLSFAL